LARRTEPQGGNLTIRQLEVFAMASRSPTFSEAAKRLGITQPSLSNSIAKIEEQLGVSLFDRTTRTLALTPAGEQLAAVAADLVQDFQSLVRGIGESAERQRGRMSISMLPSVAMSIAPKALNRFFETYPHFDVALHDMNQDKALAWILDRVVDFGIIGKASLPSELVSETVYVDEFYGVCRKDSPLARRKSLKWEDLAEAPLIMSGSAIIRGDIEAAWSRANRTIKPRFEVEQVMTGLSLVEAGLGVTILPSLYLPTVLAGGLVSLPLGDLRVTREVAIVRRSDKAVSQPALHMIACFRQCFGGFEPDLLRRDAASQRPSRSRT
jgi:LysR family carnitine catabolism transcriptional activator